MKVNAAGATKIGAGKEANEDSFVFRFMEEDHHSFGFAAVADGVGGLQRGDMASRMAISQLNRWWEQEAKNHPNDQEYLIETLRQRIASTNTAIREYGKRESLKLATTLSLLFIYDGEGTFFHVGDSRIYRVMLPIHSGILQITTDQAELVEATVKGRRVLKSALTSVLGYHKNFALAEDTFPLRKKEIYLICSDGLYKTMEAKKILTIAKKQKDLNLLCEKLIRQAVASGETDDISVIAVKIND